MSWSCKSTLNANIPFQSLYAPSKTLGYLPPLPLPKPSSSDKGREHYVIEFRAEAHCVGLLQPKLSAGRLLRQAGRTRPEVLVSERLCNL